MNVDTVMQGPTLQLHITCPTQKKVMQSLSPQSLSFYFFSSLFQTSNCQLKIAVFFQLVGEMLFSSGIGEENFTSWGRGVTTKHLFFPFPSPSRGRKQRSGSRSRKKKGIKK